MFNLLLLIDKICCIFFIVLWEYLFKYVVFKMNLLWMIFFNFVVWIFLGFDGLNGYFVGNVCIILIFFW